MGAAGIVLTAAGAHGKAGTGLDSAGYLLCLMVVGGFILGAALFAADVAARAYLSHRLFPFAAPAGGMIMIVSWLGLAVAALAALRAGEPAGCRPDRQNF